MTSVRSPGITRLTLYAWAGLDLEQKDAVNDWLESTVRDLSRDVYDIWILGIKAIVYYHKRNEDGQFYRDAGEVARSYRIVDSKGWPL